MQSKKIKKKSKKNKTIKNTNILEINKYIMKRGDVFDMQEIAENIDIKKGAIDFIIDFYKDKATKHYNESGNSYLHHLASDLLTPIGSKLFLDKEGVKLWNYVNKMCNTKGKPELDKIKNLMNELPIYYLYTLIGMNTYFLKFNIP
tara:strand:+ start:348 stop:785 length:438 start_codon:yes stop_codon:yes gene_type:complete